MALSNWTTPHKLNETEKATIVGELSRLLKSGSGEQGSRFFSVHLQGRPPLFVKHSDMDVFAEASTQTFFHTLSRPNRSTEVFDVFNTQEGDYFLVMEKVEGKTLASPDIPQDQAVQLVATAIQWLQDQLPSVPDTMFGRISCPGARLWHPFFKDHRARRIFADANDLATFISQVSQRCRKKEDRLSVDGVLNLFGKHRQICHSDITLDNFLVNSEAVWIVDFQHISVLPEVFQNYAYFNCGITFAAQVGKRLDQKPSSEANAMVPITSVIHASGSSSL